MGIATRQSRLSRPGVVVVKVGTNVLADAQGHLDSERIRKLAGQLQGWRLTNWQVVLVSSGAIGAGVGCLALGKRPTDLPQLQACAAVGQTALMQEYIRAFAPHAAQPAQILLTAADFENRSRYLNVRNTLLTLFEYGCVPIINENDTVSVAEIKFGDNDHLAALVANLMQAELLVLLTNVDGLYSADPRSDLNATILTTVPRIDRTILDLAQATKSSLGTGGMTSKLRAARLATAGGTAVLMANGARDGILDDLRSGLEIGSYFPAESGVMPAFKRWIGTAAKPVGLLLVDDGAKRAMLEQGKSLLAVGVREVLGEFGKGDLVSVADSIGVEFGRGLSNYSATDAAHIAGKSSEEISELLGGIRYRELIHRDNFVAMS